MIIKKFYVMMKIQKIIFDEIDTLMDSTKSELNVPTRLFDDKMEICRDIENKIFEITKKMHMEDTNKELFIDKNKFVEYLNMLDELKSDEIKKDNFDEYVSEIKNTFTNIVFNMMYKKDYGLGNKDI